MSLERVFDKDKTQKILDVMPDEMIVWKVVVNPEFKFSDVGPMTKQWHAAFNKNNKPWPFTAHRNTAKMGSILVDGQRYECGFHSFVKQSSLDWMSFEWGFGREIKKIWSPVTALVKKEWITSLGVEGQNNIVIVSSKIIMPTYPNTDITKELGKVTEPEVELIESIAL